jgi:lipopolysaccharide transport system permease protein
LNKRGFIVASTYELLIEPRKGWQPIDLSELWSYRELLGFFVWRDIKIRYKQTLLGGLWAVLQPLVGMVIFGVVFNRVAGIQSDGPPYPLFVFAGLVPWTFFQNAVGLASNSLIGSEQMIRKIYFPRVLIPLGQILGLGLDMVISLGFTAGLMVYYHQRVTLALAWLPIFVLGASLASAGLGLFLSALNVRYRDVKYIVPFFTQMLFFLTPVLYPASRMSGKLKILLSLNPMAGVVEGFRYTLLGSHVSASSMTLSLTGCAILFLGGLFFFRRVERTFADVI